MIPRRQVNIRPDKKTIILCINPDSDSDVVIEEEEGNFRETCIITSRNERNVEEEAEQADDERSEPLTIEGTEPETSLAADQETEDKDKTISSTSTQDFDREKVEREFINLASHYQQIRESFKKLVEEVPHMKKRQLVTNLAKMPILPMIKIDEKVSSMYGQRYEEKPSQVQEECDPEVYGENAEKKLQSIINSIGDQSALFLMAVGDCVVNKRSQAEVAMKYNIPRSRIQRTVYQGKSLATIRHFKPTGDVLTKLQQRIDTDIDTLYRIVQELPGINQTVFMTSQGEWTANQLQYLPR